MKFCFYCCVLGIAVFATGVHAEPTARVGASYYYIKGGSALVLSAQMDQKGPTGVDGKRHPARTKWDVQWRFRHNMHDGVCKMEKVSVKVGVTTVRPRWREKAQGQKKLRARWEKLLKAIDLNEAYHQKQALDAGKNIEAALNSLDLVKSCDELTKIANQVATEILGKHQQESRDYDLENDNGRKNGVSLI